MLGERVNKCLKKINRLLHNISIYRHENALLTMKKNLWKTICFTEEQKKEIQSVFHPYRNHKWHKLYQAYSGTFHENYFPEVLFSTKLEPLYYPENLCAVYQEKSMYDILYGGISSLKLPKTVVVNCSGIYYDGKRNVINRDMAISYVEHWNKSSDFVIKPVRTYQTGKKALICKADAACCSDKIAGYFDEYHENFIIQERILNYNEVGLLHTEVVNKISIMTYILDGRLFHTPIILNMGGNQKKELYIYVKDDGFLHKEAVSETGKRYLEHPESKIVFEGNMLPNMNKLIECAYSCHKRTPHIRFITWEFALDQNANPVLMDAKMKGQSIWLTQAVSGEAIFGDNTKNIFGLIDSKIIKTV